MKHLIRTFAAVMLFSGMAATLVARQPGEKLKVATTIDFLDYAFFDTPEGDEYFKLEDYEERIKMLAEAGIDKIYLRVNACGATNYPTLVSERYGVNGRLHWGEFMKASLVFARTLDTYDNLAETIRLGHKYGMEVWAWDSLNDDGGTRMTDDIPPECQRDAEALHFTPLMEGAYFRHPEWQSQRNPLCVPSKASVAASHEKARRLPVARIVMVDSENVDKGAASQPSSALRIIRDEVEIYTSADNRRYVRYQGDFQMRGYRDAAGRLCCELSGFELAGPYIKLAHRVYSDGKWSIAVRKRTGDCLVYNTDGELVEHYWAYVKDGDKETTGFDFEHYWSCAWDYGNQQLGIILGTPAEGTDGDQYFGGFTEFAVDDALAFRLRKFAEVANYPFDGFMINVRTHSIQNLCPGNNYEEYGFNPEVREKTIARCGKDPVVEASAVPTMNQIRAEAIAEYFRGCKRLVGNRPLYFSGLPNNGSNYYKMPYGKLPWLYSRYFAEGSIDGIMMCGSDFREEFTPEVLQGRDVKLGFLREMGYPPKGYDLEKDLLALRDDLAIDEVELYETMVLTHNAALLEVIKRVIGK